MNCLVLLLLLFGCCLGTSPYLTSLFGNAEINSVNLLTNSFTVTSGFDQQNTSVTYIQSYTVSPDVAYAVGSMSYSFTATTGTSTSRLSYDLRIVSKSLTGFTIEINCTSTRFSAFSIRYMTVLSSSPSFDVRVTSQTFITSGTTSIGSINSNSRTNTMTITYRDKSNVTNGVVLYMTVGATMQWTNTQGFSYTMANGTLGTSSYPLSITVPARVGLSSIRIVTLNYELIQLSSGQYADVLLNTATTSGSVSTTSTSLQDFSMVYGGLVDYNFDQTSTAVTFRVSFVRNTYSITGMKTTRNSFLWYRQIVCPEGYYYSSSGSTCLACHYSCATCDNSSLINKCLTCSANNYRTYSNGYCLCMTNYIEVAGIPTCSYAVCEPTCLTCSNLEVCGTCNSSHFRTLSDARCLCNQRYYDDYPNTLICQPCDYTCLTCISSSSCTTCDQTNQKRVYKASTGSCLCLQGYYDVGNGVTATCSKCHYSCKTCSSNSNCLTCSSDKNREQTTAGTGYCTCKQGYYDDGSNQLCVRCHYSCSSCTQSGCLQCASATRTLTGSSCPCISSRYYDDGSNPDCLECHYSCMTCTNSTSCATCNSTKYRVMNTTRSDYCSCQQYYFEQTAGSQMCSTCHVTCLTCQSDQSNGCLSCNSNAYRELTTSKECVCSIGYYAVTATTEQCQSCLHSCLTCTNNTECLTCDTGDNRQNVLPLCTCQDGYYDSGVAMCQACNHQCLTCTNNSQCLTCHSSRNSTNLVTCLCLDGYFDDGHSSICQECLQTCKTCANREKCLTCDPLHNRYLSADNDCICNSQTYDELSTFPVCQNCHYSCLRCNGTTSSSCTVCDETKNREFNNSVCQCKLRYFDDGSSSQCQSCHYSCSTCNNNLNCLTCNPAMGRFINGNLCECQAGTYDDGSHEQCQPCHHSCYTCTNSTQCLSCNLTAHRVMNGTLCDCIDGYKDNGVEQLCSLCHYSCQECSDYDSCTQCNPLYMRTFDNVESCPCNDGYFDNLIALCSACHYSCLTCQTASTCLTCNSTNHRVLDVSCICQDGYYDVPGNTVCQQCPVGCSTCYSLTQCSTCVVGSNRYLDSTCLCHEGYYDSGVAICAGCHFSCLTCTNATQCQSCSADRVLNSTTKVCSCIQGYYNIGVRTCQKCHYSCLECMDGSACTSCDAAIGRVQNGSYCGCMTGYFDNGLDQICQRCHYSCKNCTNATQCSTCDSTIHRQPLELICRCSDGYYDDGTNQLCLACHHSCQKCLHNTQCTQCNIAMFRLYNDTTDLCHCQEGYFDDGVSQMCQSCHVSCITCTNATACTGCNLTQFRNNSLLPNSLCVCLDGYYDSGQPSCQPCLYHCLTCLNDVNCETCDPTKFRILNNSVCECDTGYYDIQTNNMLCASCSFRCLTCSESAAKCLTCDTVNFRELSTTIPNTCPCMQKYYDDGQAACQPCLYHCSSCSNNTACKTCNLTNFRYMNNGICMCVEGYFDQNVELCSNCHYSCRTCTNGTECLDCQSNSLRTLSASNQCICNQKYYDDGSSAICKQCAYYCDSCSQADICDTCDPAMNRFMNTSTNKCQCMSLFYDDTLNNSLCLTCHYSCLDCHNSSACIACDSTLHRAFTTVSTLCGCLPGFFDDGSSSGCQSCIPGCLTCTNSSGCISCNGSDNRVADLVTRQCNCKDGYYHDAVSGNCLICHYSCDTCVDGSTCSGCNSTYHRHISNSQCLCDDKYYDDGQHMYCLSCHHSCQTCAAATACSACDSTKNRVAGSTFCDCSPGFYDDGQQELCLPCDSRCLTCSLSATNCTACSTANFRANPPACDCQLNSYNIDGVQQCQPCQYSCRTCTNATQCVTCDISIGRSMNSSTRVCYCVDGYFDDMISQACQPCHYSCATCSSGSSCLNCTTTNRRYLDTNQCLCQIKYYDDGSSGVCKSCHFSCQSCTNYYCDGSCDVSKYRIVNTTSRLCDCQVGYFSHNSQQQCLLCNPSCVSCSSGLSCDTCNAANHRILQSVANQIGVLSPYCTCQERYYASSSTSCSTCHYSCQLCNGPSNQHCQYCNSLSNRQLNGSSCVCSLRYYDDGSNEQCQSCHTRCLRCTNNAFTDCQQCAPTFYLLATTCYDICPDTYYGVGDSCQSCGANCRNCINSTNCTRCVTRKVLQQGICLDTCIEGFFQETVGGDLVCTQCPVSCSACSSLITCSLCSHGYYLTSNSYCLPCSNMCNGCTGPSHTECTNCNYPLFLQQGTCINITCQDYQFVDTLQGCLNCSTLYPNSYSCLPNQVLTCTLGYKEVSSTACIFCSSITGYHFVDKQCLEICGDGLVFELPCDDGNSLSGDGCNDVCAVEDGWTCNQASPSVCILTGGLEASVTRQEKIPVKNEVEVYLRLSRDLRLDSSNFQISFDQRKKQPQKVIMQNLKNYVVTVEYDRDIQTTTAKLRIFLWHSRRLLSASPIVYLNISFPFTVQTYPPAVYHDAMTLFNIERLKSFCQFLAILSLIFCCIGFLMFNKMVQRSIQTLNFLVILFLSLGYSLDNYTDWMQSLSQSVRQASLIGGFSTISCSTCVTVPINVRHHFDSQFTMNSGIIFTLTFIFLGLLLIFYVVHRQSQSYGDNHVRFRQFFKVYRYYCIAWILGFNLSMFFSTVISLRQQTEPLNMTISILVVLFHTVFTVLLFIWSRDINKELMNPVQITSKVTIQNDRSRKSQLDLFDGTSPQKVSEIGSVDSSPSKQIEGPIKSEKDEIILLAYDLHNLYREENKWAALFNFISFFRNLLMLTLIGCLTSEPIARLTLVFVLLVSRFVYLAVVRPFTERLDNIKQIVLEGLLTLMSLLGLIGVLVPSYSLGVEILLVFAFCISLLVNLVLQTLQIIHAQQAWIKKKLIPCLVRFRWWKKRGLDQRKPGEVYPIMEEQSQKEKNLQTKASKNIFDLGESEADQPDARASEEGTEAMDFFQKVAKKKRLRADLDDAYKGRKFKPMKEK